MENLNGFEGLLKYNYLLIGYMKYSPSIHWEVEEKLFEIMIDKIGIHNQIINVSHHKHHEITLSYTRFYAKIHKMLFSRNS